MVKEKSIIIGFDTPVTSDERDGVTRTLGSGVRVRVPEAMVNPFLVI